MSFFTGVEPGTVRHPSLSDRRMDGVGTVEITSACITAPSPKDGVRYALVEGINVDHPALPPGTKIKVFMQKLGDIMTGKNVGTFLVAAIGDCSDQLAEQCFGDRSPLIGRRVRIQTTTGRIAKKSGKEYTGTDYFPADGQTVVTPVSVKAPPAPAAPAATPFPPQGWYLDPHGRGYYDANGSIKSEAELRGAR